MTDNKLELLDGGLDDNAVILTAEGGVLEIVLKNEDSVKFAFLSNRSVRELMDWLNRQFDSQE